MLLLRVSEIEVGERIRKVYDEERLEELRESIEESGLIHPPTVRREGGKYVLVAGHRRLLAVSRVERPYMYCGEPVEPGYIPVLVWDELDPVEAKAIELAENVARHDITWQEKVKATAELHALMG